MFSKEEIESLYKAFHAEMPLFMALADNERLHIFLRILQSGLKGIHVNEITSFSKLSRPAVSHHLKVLKESGLISFNKIGTKMFYYVPSSDKFNELKKNLSVLENGLSKVDFEEIKINSDKLVNLLEDVKS